MNNVQPQVNQAMVNPGINQVNQTVAMLNKQTIANVQEPIALQPTTQMVRAQQMQPQAVAPVAQAQNTQATPQVTPVANKYRVGNVSIDLAIVKGNLVPNGWLPLNNLFIQTVIKTMQHFGKLQSIENYWVDFSRRIFKSVYEEGDKQKGDPTEIARINFYSVLSYLNTCMKNNLDPLCDEEIAPTYDRRTHNVKATILLDGYNKIYNSHPKTDGLEWVFGQNVEKEIIVTEWVWDDVCHRKTPKEHKVIKYVPSYVECKIYLKGQSHPTSNIADTDDIGTSAAWKEHPRRMMMNRAFTRAVRTAYNLEGLSEDDLDDIKNSAYKEQALEMERYLQAVNSNLDRCTTKSQLAQIEKYMFTKISDLDTLTHDALIAKYNDVKRRVESAELQAQVAQVAPVAPAVQTQAPVTAQISPQEMVQAVLNQPDEPTLPQAQVVSDVNLLDMNLNNNNVNSATANAGVPTENLQLSKVPEDNLNIMKKSQDQFVTQMSLEELAKIV